MEAQKFNLSAKWGLWLRRHPCRFTPSVDNRYPFYRRLGWLLSRSERVLNVWSPPVDFDPRTVQPLGSRYAKFSVQVHSF